MNADRSDRAIRWAAVLAVLAVAGVAGYVSYFHAVEVVSGNGEPGIIARLYPASIDGLIIAASAVLLDAARHAEDAPVLAWLLLAAGIVVTLAANVTFGARHGAPGALWAAWPALAFVGSYELLLLLARASARRAPRTDSRTDTEDDSAPGNDADGDGEFRLTGREAIIADLAEQIRNAIATGERWQPDYAVLMTQTGYQRSWCEKAVREARTVAFLTSVRPPALARVNGQHSPDSGDSPPDP